MMSLLPCFPPAEKKRSAGVRRDLPWLLLVLFLAAGSVFAGALDCSPLLADVETPPAATLLADGETPPPAKEHGEEDGVDFTKLIPAAAAAGSSAGEGRFARLVEESKMWDAVAPELSEQIWRQKNPKGKKSAHSKEGRLLTKSCQAYERMGSPLEQYGDK